MLITFKPVIYPQGKRADGTWPVYIRVYFSGKIRRIPTTLVARQGDITRTGALKSQSVIDKANDLIKRMRGSIAHFTVFELEDHGIDWIVERMRSALVGERFRLDFFEFGDEWIQRKKPSTRRAYITALSAMERHLGRRTLDVNDITKAMLLQFVNTIENEPKMHFYYKTGKMLRGKTQKAEGASSRHLMKLAAIYQAAKDQYNDEDSGVILIPRSPFSTIKRSYPVPKGQRSVGFEVMQQIISAQVRTQMEREALDLFVVSFALMGANLADLFFATPPQGGVWKYNRMKTASRRADGAPMEVTVPEELEPFIARLQDGPSGWWLPALHRISAKKDICTAKVNAALRKWCKSEGVPEFTFYAARHTWATLARKWGVEKATVDECLVHKGDYDVTDIYLEKDWDLLAKANRVVLSHFQW